MSHRPLYFASRISQENKLKKVVHRDSQCPTSIFTLWRIKLNCIIKLGQIPHPLRQCLFDLTDGRKPGTCWAEEFTAAARNLGIFPQARANDFSFAGRMIILFKST
jgi:hypothetical protein